jgi:hypothetical protein
MNADSETVLYSFGTARWDRDSRPCLTRRASFPDVRSAYSAIRAARPSPILFMIKSEKWLL